MKVLVVSHQAEYIYGGEVVTLAMLLGLQEQRIATEFASPAGPYQARAAASCRVHTISSIEFRRRHGLLPKFLWAWWKTFHELRRIVRERGIDIVHANTLKAMVYVWPLGALGICPVVWHHHDILPATHANALWARALAWAATRIVTPSQAAADALSAAGVPAEKVVAVWNGFDPDPWTNHALAPRDPAAPFVIGFVGELSRRKGADRLVAIAAAVETRVHADFVLKIVGSALSEPEMAEALRASAAPLVARGKVELLGRRDWAGVLEFLKGVDVLILPSRQDPFPTVILEAAFSGIPTVAARVGGVAEMVRHGENGYFADSDDEFADRLAELISDRPRSRRLGAAARRFAEENFSVAQMAKKLCAVYDECMKS